MGRDEQLVRELAARIPEFEEMLSDHIENEHGVLPHMFFWDVYQETMRSFLAHDDEAASDLPDWREVLRFLEEQSSLGIREVDGVIVTSFLEYLPYPGEEGHDIVEHLGPVLAAKFARIRPAG
ncbi:hypothetical protein KV205_23125 [Streptomyces sp. SKN60]|uniref:hypothetical protein n=1 Tax=Streptomyces sp. SKN60 TaxID=2855506 RepID=UPI00224701E3|nr:hypothetical protein [Streptomyces sp. SKN60]MCX2183400.1 hypothetical protein [Streptomyces sp. SKN60]